MRHKAHTATKAMDTTRKTIVLVLSSPNVPLVKTRFTDTIIPLTPAEK
jgi:hypothetical protein